MVYVGIVRRDRCRRGIRSVQHRYACSKSQEMVRAGAAVAGAGDAEVAAIAGRKHDGRAAHAGRDLGRGESRCAGAASGDDRLNGGIHLIGKQLRCDVRGRADDVHRNSGSAADRKLELIGVSVRCGRSYGRAGHGAVVIGGGSRGCELKRAQTKNVGVVSGSRHRKLFAPAAGEGKRRSCNGGGERNTGSLQAGIVRYLRTQAGQSLGGGQAAGKLNVNGSRQSAALDADDGIRGQSRSCRHVARRSGHVRKILSGGIVGGRLKIAEQRVRYPIAGLHLESGPAGVESQLRLAAGIHVNGSGHIGVLQRRSGLRAAVARALDRVVDSAHQRARVGNAGQVDGDAHLVVPRKTGAVHVKHGAALHRFRSGIGGVLNDRRHRSRTPASGVGSGRANVRKGHADRLHAFQSKALGVNGRLAQVQAHRSVGDV